MSWFIWIILYNHELYLHFLGISTLSISWTNFIEHVPSQEADIPTFRTSDVWYRIEFEVLRPLRLRQHVPLKCQLNLSGLYSFISQNIELVDCHFKKNMPLDPIVTQFNQDNILTCHYFKKILILSYHLYLVLTRRFSFHVSWLKFCMQFWSICLPYVPPKLFLYKLNIIIFSEETKSWSPLLCNFLYPNIIFSKVEMIFSVFFLQVNF